MITGGHTVNFIHRNLMWELAYIFTSFQSVYQEISWKSQYIPVLTYLRRVEDGKLTR